ncbi:hypothetical protein FBU30_002199 [Linnemannia zychae]|nr:hypothetical protein FBU30_002199 [Linnemannia zychae]
MVLQQFRAGHSWISGHPHSHFYKPATAVNQSKNTGVHGSGNNVNTGSGSSNSNSGSSSFLDFAGNSRYQAYTLARFSTLSLVSSASSSSSSSSSSPSSGAAVSSGPHVLESSSTRQELTEGASGRHQAHSNPADAQSPVSSTTPSSSSASSLPEPTSSVSVSPSSKQEHDDVEDAWAINESYSGHAPSTSTTSSNNSKDDHPRQSFRSDVNSTKLTDPAAIDASWRRTSDSIPSTSFPNNKILSSSSSSKAGGLDLSSSTLVQQMLFKERAPHDDRLNNNNNEPKQEHHQQQQHPKEGNPSSHRIEGWDDDDDDNNNDHMEQREDQGQLSTSRVAADSKSTSPSLASMLMNQSSGDASDSRKVKDAEQQKQQQQQKGPQDEEDHISKLDIRVGIVRSVTQHPDAESLYIEQIDVGDKENGATKEPRTIVSGLVKHVPKDYLEGRAVIVVGNMKPSKLRGVMSQGMLLCAMEQDEKGEVIKVGLLEPAEGSQAGDKVTFEGYTDLETVPAAVLTPKKKWFEKSRVHFSVQDGIAYYKGSPFKTVQGLVRCKSISKGQIS